MLGTHLAQLRPAISWPDMDILEAEATSVEDPWTDRQAGSSLDKKSALSQYLTHIIAHNRYLQLQGVHSGGRLVHIELEEIYVTLRATQQHTVSNEERWLAAEAELIPSERQRMPHDRGDNSIETVTVSINEALSAHQRLVVLGDSGSGKTTLLRYLALLYARDLDGQTDTIQTHLAGVN